MGAWCKIAGIESRGESMKVGSVNCFSTRRWSPETTSMLIVGQGPATLTRIRSARPIVSGSLPSMLTFTVSADEDGCPLYHAALRHGHAASPFAATGGTPLSVARESFFCVTRFHSKSAASMTEFALPWLYHWLYQEGQ